MMIYRNAMILDIISAVFVKRDVEIADKNGYLLRYLKAMYYDREFHIHLDNYSNTSNCQLWN